MAPMSSNVSLNVHKTVREYEALVGATFSSASSSRTAHEEVCIETNALFHVRDLRKICERVQGPLEIRDSADGKDQRVTRQPLRFDVYDSAMERQDEADVSVDTDAVAQDDQPQLRAVAADIAEPVAECARSNSAVVELEDTVDGKINETDAATNDVVEVAVEQDEKIEANELATERFFAFALTLVMRVILWIVTTAAIWLMATLRWFVLSVVWWTMAAVLTEAVALVVGLVVVFSVAIGASYRASVAVSRASFVIGTFTIKVLVQVATWCLSAFSKLLTSTTETLKEASKSKEKTIGSDPKSLMKAVNKAPDCTGLARLSPPSTPASVADTASESESEAEMHFEVVTRSSPPSDQHAAMGFGPIDTVDRSNLSVAGVLASVDAVGEEASPRPVSPRHATAEAVSGETCAPAPAPAPTLAPALEDAAASAPPTSTGHRSANTGKRGRVNHGLPYGRDVQSVYLKYETQSPSYERNLAAALARRETLTVQSVAQAQAARGWR